MKRASLILSVVLAFGAGLLLQPVLFSDSPALSANAGVPAEAWRTFQETGTTLALMGPEDREFFERSLAQLGGQWNSLPRKATLPPRTKTSVEQALKDWHFAKDWWAKEETRRKWFISGKHHWGSSAQHFQASERE